MPCDDCLRMMEAVREIAASSEQRLSWPEFLRRMVKFASRIEYECDAVSRATVQVSPDYECDDLHVDVRVEPAEGVEAWDAREAALGYFAEERNELYMLAPLNVDVFITY